MLVSAAGWFREIPEPSGKSEAVRVVIFRAGKMGLSTSTLASSEIFIVSQVPRKAALED
jgi:hypothetical protein